MGDENEIIYPSRECIAVEFKERCKDCFERITTNCPSFGEGQDRVKYGPKQSRMDLCCGIIKIENNDFMIQVCRVNKEAGKLYAAWSMHMAEALDMASLISQTVSDALWLLKLEDAEILNSRIREQIKAVEIEDLKEKAMRGEEEAE